MPAMSNLNWGVYSKFQSAPGLEAGRCGGGAGGHGRASRFNPRPALRPGDAQPCRTYQSNLSWFQSAPGLEAGRCEKMLSGDVMIS